MTDLSTLSDADLMGMLQQQVPAAAPSLALMSDADLMKALQQPSVGADIAKSGGIGLAKGAIGLAGSLGDAMTLGNFLVDKGASLFGASPETIAGAKAIRDRGYSSAGTAPTSQGIQSTLEQQTGKFYEPQTIPGQYAQTIGEFAPAGAVGPGGAIRRVATQAVLPALASETAGQATAGTTAEPYARIAAAVASPSVAGVARRLVTPLPANAARQAAIQTLANEGVPATAGQATGSTALRYLESSLGDAPFAGNQATRAAEQQAEAFTSATLRRAGEMANRATPQVVDRAFTRIGGEFDRLAANNTLQADRRLNADLQTTELEYNRMVPQNSQAPVVREMIQDIRDTAARNGGIIPGDQYQAYRSRLDRYGRGSRADPQLSGALFDVRNALDDAMQRSIRPQDRGAWQEARRQYRNILVIERAATGAGENTAQGLISPASLRNATVNQNRRAYARGQGDFADLAHAGESIMRPMPQSGTAPRAFAAAIPAIVGAGLAGGPGAAIGAGASIGAPGLVGRLLMSRPMQAYLGNQLMQPNQNAQLINLRRLLLASPASLPLRLTPPQINGPGQ